MLTASQGFAQGFTMATSMADAFMPHGMCYLWTPGLLWLHAGSDTLIAIAYLIIPLVLLYIVSKRRAIIFNWMILLFGVFIVACGLTHVMGVWNIWNADYWLSGTIKLVTAVVSLATAILLIRLVPEILRIPSHRELRQAHEQLSHAYEELEQFSYAVSHDLRAPLRAVEGYGQALEDSLGQDLDETSAHYLKRMREASSRMGELIDDLLDLSRLTREEVTSRDIDLTRMATEVSDEQQRAHPERNIEFRIAREMNVIGDPNLLRAALTNLVSNAVKFTADRDPGIIEIGRENRDGQETFFVKDNGAGFEPRYSDKLFTVFQRLHTTDEFTGNGVGLATVQRIIHRHGGTIRGEGMPDKGATFYFTLAETNDG